MNVKTLRYRHTWGRSNIMMPSCEYHDFNYKDKPVSRLSCLANGNIYTWALPTMIKINTLRAVGVKQYRNQSHVRYRFKCSKTKNSDISGFCTQVWIFSGRSYVIIRGSLWINALRPSDAIWRHRAGSTLAQVMAFCLTAPSHYLNQC